ncbi:MAG: DUF362 domain-containing protein [Chthoniobacterales bacterium]
MNAVARAVLRGALCLVWSGVLRAEPPAPRLEPELGAPDRTPSIPAAVETAEPRAKVFFALMPAAVEGGTVREGMVRRMVDEVVMAAAARPGLAEAWRVFVQPQDRVGIKVSATAAPLSSTHPAVVAAVAEGLVAAGVEPRRIVIWDRSARDLERAGYGELARRFRVVGTDRAGGYSEKETVTAAVMGKLISGDRGFDAQKKAPTSSKSHLSSVLIDEVDKVIHVPSLTDSVFAGLHGALAGMVLDNLDNWRRLARAPHYGDPFLPELYADPRLGGKVVLTILDALRPQYGGGPFPGAEFKTNYGAIFASRDAVAIDVTGLRLLDNFREEAGMTLLAGKIHWPGTAAMLGLGTADEEAIEMVRAGLEAEVRWSEP